MRRTEDQKTAGCCLYLPGGAWLPGYLVTWLPCCLVTLLPGYLFSWLPGWNVTWSSGLSVDCLADETVACLTGWLVTCLTHKWSMGWLVYLVTLQRTHTHACILIKFLDCRRDNPSGHKRSARSDVPGQGHGIKGIMASMASKATPVEALD